jgi:hypothetical protein
MEGGVFQWTPVSCPGTDLHRNWVSLCPSVDILVLAVSGLCGDRTRITSPPPSHSRVKEEEIPCFHYRFPLPWREDVRGRGIETARVLPEPKPRCRAPTRQIVFQGISGARHQSGTLQQKIFYFFAEYTNIDNRFQAEESVGRSPHEERAGDLGRGAGAT